MGDAVSRIINLFSNNKGDEILTSHGGTWLFELIHCAFRKGRLANRRAFA